MPAITPASTAWPLPDTPARPVISPARRLSVTRRAGRAAVRAGASTRAQHEPGGRRARQRLAGVHLAPDHQFGKLGALGPFAVARRPPCLPPRSTSTRSPTAITSLSLCEMKMIDRPLADQQPQRGEQRLGLRRRQHRGRLVEDQDARIAVERLQDLDPLPLADRQRADTRRRDRRAGRNVAASRACSLRARRRGRASATALGAEHDVLQHRHVVGQREMLVHHADAGGERRARVAAAAAAGRTPRRSLVGDVVAEQDVHQGRLAGAVLAEQRDDLAPRSSSESHRWRPARRTAW